MDRFTGLFLSIRKALLWSTNCTFVFSPNYPDYYPRKKDCVWHFTTTPGHRIRLHFTSFEMEPHQECAYDHIAIYNGDSPESFTLGRFCGSKLPHPISASSNEMFMVFKSDASVQRQGFAATHSTGKIPSRRQAGANWSSWFEIKTIASVSACGGHLSATTKVKHFYSHARFGDNNYDNNADCDWTIEAELGRHVQLTFLTFDVRIKYSIHKFPSNFPSLLRSRMRNPVLMTTWIFSVAWTTTVAHSMADTAGIM